MTGATDAGAGIASDAMRPPIARLSLMMFFEYAVWGAWLPVAARYLSAPVAEGGLGFSGYQIGAILGLAGSVGALAAPFIAGQLADRHFRTERCLAVLLGFGGIVKWITAYQTSYTAWLGLSVAYSVLYMPTLALSNSLAFAHLADADREFPKIRVWGTIGWICVAWAFPMLFLEQHLGFQRLPPFLVGQELPDSTRRLGDALKFSGVISLGFAAYALSLPATRPARDATEKLAFAKAFALLKRRSFLVLLVTSLVVSVLHQIYFLQTSPFLSALGVKNASILPAMSVGQFAEIGMMGVLGFLLRRFGFRTVLSLGAFGYFARYALFGTVTLPLGVIIGSQVLHGVCYACFFAAAFIYVDRVAEPDVRHSAQTVIGITILGGGPVIGGWVSGFLQQRFATPTGVDYSALWYTLAAAGLVSAIVFAFLFAPEARVAPPKNQ